MAGWRYDPATTKGETMVYTTKYEMFQEVWGICDETFRQIVKCLTCRATGKVTIGTEEFVCPKCNGRSAHPVYVGRKWFVAENGVIGKIDVTHFPGDYHGHSDTQAKYMIDATGVGSGRVWDEDLLFVDRDAAERECARRNGVLPQDEAVMLPEVQG
jgi:hypothetical protein